MPTSEHQADIEHYSTLLVKYINIVDTICLPLREDQHQFSTSYALYCENAKQTRSQNESLVAAISGQDQHMHTLYRREMEKLVEKEPATFYDRIEIASAALHLINELQFEIRKLPWTARLDVERRKYELHQETLKSLPPATWVPTSLLPVVNLVSMNNEDQPLSPDEVGVLIRDDAYRRQAAQRDLMQSEAQAVTPPPDQIPSRISKKQLAGFQAAHARLLGRIFQRMLSPAGEVEIFLVQGIEVKGEQLFFRISSSAVGRQDVPADEFWSLIKQSKVFPMAPRIRSGSSRSRSR
ncbi:hypothetical protein VKT23_000371 [Stygiomarasmius scandens]|uniref:Uncharacterized protein n=1 Tax=Marasmiellus scandens TaxID=2682957 RepID=A0ABR1K795_9AGAR